MQYHKQTTETNCFRTCVACLLDLGISEIPDCCNGTTSEWSFEKFQRWLANRGLQAIEVNLGVAALHPVSCPVDCILTGPSPRGGGLLHAVVGRFQPGFGGFDVVHDPHPSDEGIVDIKHILFFVPIVISCVEVGKAQERACLEVIFSSVQRLRALGWRDPHSDDAGKDLLIVEADSTGIFSGSLVDGDYLVVDGGDRDVFHSRPMLVKDDTRG